MNGDDNFFIVICECFVDSVIYYFEYYVVQIGVVICVVDIYIWVFMYCIQFFQDFDIGGVIRI